ncbi:uncharacterized protein L969DRAFT_91316 [Mixia osmundae IAM 14324]|uniref:Uncharacterized protein n=1 Tax=Mixia osmundae (strain CBS 9802 / IAM 14324 / JCM 22182 / KY 12970) TaxID=764103 RepID=G7E4M5_MIXOS|nr:uncharacterized protein L969DRAFT_91316 [Mixia osmundae IAM 14324]KEI41835.1 hypothetical protein L969DRAFT_91316 [Mixia osmundae IAM 14324]GAA97785.1 hypothetical protein E5Q_04464 [Mixia osmundae IAM 14324]
MIPNAQHSWQDEDARFCKGTARCATKVHQRGHAVHEQVYQARPKRVSHDLKSHRRRLSHHGLHRFLRQADTHPHQFHIGWRSIAGHDGVATRHCTSFRAPNCTAMHVRVARQLGWMLQCPTSRLAGIYVERAGV